MAYIVDIYGTKTIKFGDFDSDVAQLGGYIQGDTIYRDGVIYTATTDIPAGTPFTIADSELVPNAWYKAVVGANSKEALGSDSDLLVRLNRIESDHDSDIKVAVHNYLANDSDIQKFLTIDHDSDIRVAVHDYLAADSDFDSEIKRVIHAFLAADSDLAKSYKADLDSDIAAVNHNFKASDSDLRADMDSDFTVIYHDYKAADSDLRNILVGDIDSDITKLYHDFKAADSDLRADMDSDFTVVYHDYKAADSDLRSDIDSDGRTIRHDYKAADSDLLKDVDSDLNILRHDYQAADSDLSVRVTSLEDLQGHFTLNDNDPATRALPEEPGVTWWKTFDNLTNASNYKLFLSTGTYELPWTNSSTSLSSKGWSAVTVGSGFPTISATGQELYIDSDSNTLYAWDVVRGGTGWEKVTLGDNVYLRREAAEAAWNDPVLQMTFWLDLTSSTPGLNAIVYNGIIFDSYSAVNIEDLNSYGSQSGIPSIPVGSVPSGFLDYGYIQDTNQFYVSSKSRYSSGTGTQFISAVPNLFQDNTARSSSNYQQAYVDAKVFNNGATFFHQDEKKLYVREVGNGVGSWVGISGDITQADYDSDLNIIRHNFRAVDSDIRANVDSDIRVVTHDYKAADSDIIINLNASIGHFTLNEPDINSLPTINAGSTQWVLNGGSTTIHTLTSKGLVQIPAVYGATSAADLGFEVSSGTTLPTTAPTGSKGLYARTDNDTFFVYDKTVGMTDWEHIDFGPRVYATRAAAESGLTYSIGVRFVYTVDGASQGLQVATYWWTGSGSLVTSIQSVATVSTRTDLLSIWNPPTQQSSFPFYELRYVTTTEEFAFVGDAIASGDNTWIYAGEDQLITNTTPITNSSVQSLLDLGAWKDGATIYLRDTSELYAWDSLSSEWKKINPLGSAFTEDSFTATEKQVSFTLSNTPQTITGVYRNGLRLKSNSYSFVGTTVTYNPANNYGSTMDAGDDIVITYLK